MVKLSPFISSSRFFGFSFVDFKSGFQNFKNTGVRLKTRFMNVPTALEQGSVIVYIVYMYIVQRFRNDEPDFYQLQKRNFK